jgi:hypothetical protein
VRPRSVSSRQELNHSQAKVLSVVTLEVWFLIFVEQRDCDGGGCHGTGAGQGRRWGGVDQIHQFMLFPIQGVQLRLRPFLVRDCAPDFVQNG